MKLFLIQHSLYKFSELKENVISANDSERKEKAIFSINEINNHNINKLTDRG